MKENTFTDEKKTLESKINFIRRKKFIENNNGCRLLNFKLSKPDRKKLSGKHFTKFGILAGKHFFNLIAKEYFVLIT